MEGQKLRKTDRRTLYTREAIKEALLGLLAEKEYADITVADLCRAAELNRGTFYLHYGNISQVLDELLDDVLGQVRNVLDQVEYGDGGDGKCAYPFCRFLRENRKYRPLFFSDALHSRVMRRIAEVGEEPFIRRLQGTSPCSPEVLRALFHFQINGCLAVCKSYAGSPDSQWNDIQCGIDQFLKRGFCKLEKDQQPL